MKKKLVCVMSFAVLAVALAVFRVTAASGVDYAYSVKGGEVTDADGFVEALTDANGNAHAEKVDENTIRIKNNLLLSAPINISAGSYTLLGNGSTLYRGFSSGPMIVLDGSEGSGGPSLTLETDIGDEICVVANDNCPGQAVLSGQNAALDKVIAACQAARARKVVKLAVSGGFHSPMMQDAAAKMQDVLLNADMQRPLVPVVSNVTAHFEQEPAQIKKLLVRQVTGSVLWTDSVNFMHQQGIDIFVECGNGAVLTGLIKKILPPARLVNLNTAEKVSSFFQEAPQS